MAPDTAAQDDRWRGLFAAAGVSALLTALCVPLQVALFIVAPPPASREVSAWLGLFASEPVRGLLDMDLLMMVEQVLLVAVVLALAVLLWERHTAAVLLGGVLWVAGGVLFVASNTGFEMLSLARGYADAGSDAARAPYIAAAQAMLASYFDMGTGFVFGYVLTSVGGIVVGAAMARARLFGRAAGLVLAGGNLVGLAIFLPVVGIPLSLVSVLILWAWFAVAGVQLLRLALRQPSAESSPAVVQAATA